MVFKPKKETFQMLEHPVFLLSSSFFAPKKTAEGRGGSARFSPSDPDNLLEVPYFFWDVVKQIFVVMT
jgi:hypothetical protein